MSLWKYRTLFAKNVTLKFYHKCNFLYKIVVWLKVAQRDTKIIFKYWLGILSITMLFSSKFNLDPEKADNHFKLFRKKVFL